MKLDTISISRIRRYVRHYDLGLRFGYYLLIYYSIQSSRAYTRKPVVMRRHSGSGAPVQERTIARLHTRTGVLRYRMSVRSQ